MTTIDPDPTARLTTPAQRTRSFEDSPALAAQAVQMLCAARTSLLLSADEAKSIVRQMRLVSFARGAVLFREGDGSRSDYMLLLLEGDVAVDTAPLSGPQGSVTISALGPGSIIGEMAMLDGAPRSASCTAQSQVTAAGLTRWGLERLIDEQPRAAAKLLMVLAQSTAERLRAMGQQLQLYAQLSGTKRD